MSLDREASCRIEQAGMERDPAPVPTRTTEYPRPSSCPTDSRVFRLTNWLDAAAFFFAMGHPPTIREWGLCFATLVFASHHVVFQKISQPSLRNILVSF